jgi:hypothetical protein
MRERAGVWARARWLVPRPHEAVIVSAAEYVGALGRRRDAVYRAIKCLAVLCSSSTGGVTSAFGEALKAGI